MGRDFQEAGVVSGGDMTTEACTTKLAYLFGREYDMDTVSRLFVENIRGELTPIGKHNKKYFSYSNNKKV
jgi:hypothetical protein